MDVRDRKRVLGWATAATALSGVVVLAAGLLTPMQAVVDVAGARPGVAAATAASGPREGPKAPGVAGLSPEEVAMPCGAAESPLPVAEAEPELVPSSLEELGLSPE